MESFFLNGGMIGSTLDFGATDRYILANTPTRDQLVYVGSQIAAFQGTTSTATVTFNLTGGANTTPLANDLVIVAVSVGANSNLNQALAVTGYTTVAELYAPDTQSTDLFVGYKFMGSVPDTNFTRPQTGNTQHAGAYAVHVWRNVDLTTPLDVTSTVVQGLNTAIPDPPSITPTTTNTQIVVVGAAAHLAGTPTFTASYLSSFITIGSNDTVDTSIGVGNVAWTSGAYNPAAWTFSGTDNTQYSYLAVSMALRPRLIQVPTYGNLRNSGVWNLEAAYDYAFSQYTPPSQVLFTTVGTQNWTVPVGITEISAVCVGAGGAGSGADGGRTESNSGGGGGGLAYGTIAVTPGEVLTITVGAGGTSPSGGAGGNGGATSIARGVNILLQGGGGGGGPERNAGVGAAGTSTGTDRLGGGTGGSGGTGGLVSGGSGGGGAGGYSAAGGNGGTASGGTGSASTGGGGGGGGGYAGTGATVGGSGGGVGVLGAGSNGTAGATNGGGGGGGSGGTAGSTNSTTNTGSLYGGGGGGRSDNLGAGAPGGQGAARIIWGPGRAYPSTGVGDVF